MGRVTRGGNAVRGLVLVAGGLLVSGCDESGNFTLLQPQAGGASAAAAGDGPRATRLVERDVEAPDVFQATDMGLWDGRPSLGGVWVAHPDVAEPERVIIRNTADGKFVIGALFRRQREVPGPAFQVSSDAASALGLIAGSPQQLNVTALRREQAPADDAATAGDAAAQDIAPAPEVVASDLGPEAGAAIEAAEAAETAKAAAPAAPAPRPERAAASFAKPYVQVGIFSVEENARNTATALRQAGMVPTVLDQSSQGKRFWRVVVGPAASASDRAAVLKKIKGIGFADAYPVTN